MSTVLGDRYDVLAPIGSGTAANVFRVRDRRSGVLRAAKVLKPDNARVPDVLARFENEYRILRTLHHPHLPEVYDYGWTEDGGRFLVMELVDGEPLDAYFRARPRELWVILYELCEILSFIHNHALLHQDFKPSNILVKQTTAFGDPIPLVKLIDFGVTYRRDAGERVQVVGTPEYMAPEVALGEAPLTRAVDYYSLGIVLYELLCGRTPFSGSASEVMRAHIDRTPVIEEEELEWAELYPHVRGLLQRDKRERLAAFEELRRAVVTRLTGGIVALDRAYGSARIESMGMIGKAAELKELLRATMPGEGERRSWRVSVSGQPASGRGHLLDAARSEWRIRGVSSWQLGDDSDAAWLLNRPSDAASPPTEKDFEQAWGRVARAAAAGNAWVVACGELTPDEARLYEYFETGRTLAGPEIRRNLGFVTATAADRGRPTSPSDEAVHITLPTVSVRELSDVAGRFRGEMLRTADAQLIAELLKDARESGEIMRLLRRLVAESGLLFEAQRWRVVAEKAREIAREPAPRGGHLVLPLSPVQKRVMVCLACHPGPVPVGWLPGITALEDGAVASAMHDLRLRHLLEPVDMAGTPAVRTTSRAVEQAVLHDAGGAEIKNVHTRYTEKMSLRVSALSLPPMDFLRTLALHQERSGDERSAYLTRRRLFKELWKKRAYGEIEQICRDALTPKSLRFGLSRAYLRELVNVLWAQNLTARAYHDMKEFSERYGEVPKGLLPKYARGLMDALGPKKGLAFVKEAVQAHPVVSNTLVARLKVEYVLALYNMSHYDDGIALALAVHSQAHLLSPSENCRLLIYESLLKLGKGHVSSAYQSLDGAQSLAQAHRLRDEMVLIRILQGDAEVNRGRPDRGLHHFAGALRNAYRAKLILRQYQVMAHSASAYSELGDHHRAVDCRVKTVWLAQYLGQDSLLASSWWRVGHYSERYGEFGNAVRYFDRAMVLLDEYSRPTDRVYAHILYHELLDYLGSDRERDLRVIARKALTLTSDIGEQGTLEIHRAAQAFRAAKYDVALRIYRQATRKCVNAGRKDEAMRAASGAAKAALALGQLSESRRILDGALVTFGGITNGDVNGLRWLTELLFLLLTRAERSRVKRALSECDRFAKSAYMSTRLDIYLAMMRGYARLGMAEDARRVRERYDDAVRSIVANIESADLSRRFLRSLAYQDVSGEFSRLDKHGAHVVSVDVGARIARDPARSH